MAVVKIKKKVHKKVCYKKEIWISLASGKLENKIYCIERKMKLT